MAEYAAVPSTPDSPRASSGFIDSPDKRSCWETCDAVFFRCQQRVGVSHGNRSVVLQVNVDGIAVYEENMTLISEHSFTTIKSYAASVKRHTFAFKQQLVPGGEEIVHEFYLEHSRLLHDYVTKYVGKLLEHIQEIQHEKRLRDQAIALQAQRDAALAASHPLPIAPPPSSSRTRAVTHATRALSSPETLPTASPPTSLPQAMHEMDNLRALADSSSAPKSRLIAVGAEMRVRRDSLSKALQRRPSMDMVQPILRGPAAGKTAAEAAALASAAHEARLAAAAAAAAAAGPAAAAAAAAAPAGDIDDKSFFAALRS